MWRNRLLLTKSFCKATETQKSTVLPLTQSKKWCHSQLNEQSEFKITLEKLSNHLNILIFID